jgi:ATP-dependent Clp protease ATP-binding subunit ClpC
MGIEEIEAAALSELRRLFNPEFLNRVDDVVVFHALDEKQVEAILDIQINELSGRLAEQGYFITVRPGARRLLIEKGWDPKYGGRPMRRAIQKELEDPLSFLLLEEDFPPGAVFIADSHRGKIAIRPQLPGGLMPLKETANHDFPEENSPQDKPAGGKPAPSEPVRPVAF